MDHATVRHPLFSRLLSSFAALALATGCSASQGVTDAGPAGSASSVSSAGSNSGGASGASTASASSTLGGTSSPGSGSTSAGTHTSAASTSSTVAGTTSGRASTASTTSSSSATTASSMGSSSSGGSTAGPTDGGFPQTPDGGTYQSSLTVCWNDATCPRAMAIGHGGMWDAVNNPYLSNGAIALAYDGGMDGVKIDVRVSSDNIPVLAHSSPDPALQVGGLLQRLHREHDGGAD